MTRKDYVAMAKVFASFSHVCSTHQRFLLRDLAEDLCELFREDNHRFNRVKFLTACELWEQHI